MLPQEKILSDLAEIDSTIGIDEDTPAILPILEQIKCLPPDLCAELLKDDDVIKILARRNYFVEVKDLIESLPVGLQADVLCGPATRWFGNNYHGNIILELISPLTLSQKTKIYATPYNVKAIAADSLAAYDQVAWEILRTIQALQPSEQATVLATPGVIRALAKTSVGTTRTVVTPTAQFCERATDNSRAQALMDIIRALEPSQQREILMVDYGLGAASLAYAYWAHDVMAIVKEFAFSQQTELLTTQYAGPALVTNHQGTEVMSIIEKSPQDQQERILRVPDMVRTLWKDYCIRSKADRVLLGLPAEKRANVLGSDGVFSNLIANDKITLIIRAVEELNPEQRITALAGISDGGYFITDKNAPHIAALLNMLPPTQKEAHVAKLCSSKRNRTILAEHGIVSSASTAEPRVAAPPKPN